MKTDLGRIFDEYLVIAVQAGDQAAAERLAARWRPRLLRTARRMLGDVAAAEDAVQETWLALARGLPRLADPSRFPAFAYKILHRRCADAIGANVRHRSRHSSESLAEDTPATTDRDVEERLDIAAAFAALPADQRAAAILYFGEGLTLPEVATAMEIPLGTAKSRLFHARRKLKKYLEGNL